jgi:hypothetical protein
MGYTDFDLTEVAELVPMVRGSLSDIPSEQITKKQILYDLLRAKVFVETITGSTSDSVYMGQCIVSVATYYSYVNYTTLAERDLGTLPPTAQVRISTLRRIAAALLQPIAIYPITDDLTLDIDSLNIPVAAIGLTYSIMDDDV